MIQRPDPTCHASPKLAIEAPPEKFAYSLLLSGDFSNPDALAVINVDPAANDCGKIVHTVTMPNKGDEFHHFGWNACSSALSPLTGHAFIERRYLIIPGLRSSRLYIIDTKPHPTEARIHKIIEPEEVFHKTGYSRPHTVHCGPDGIYVGTLGGAGPNGTDGPPGIFIIDCQTFEVLGRWEIDRGPQTLHYDFWWNLPRNYMVSSERGLPPQFENGIVPEDLLANKYGHRVHFWDLTARRKRRHPRALTRIPPSKLALWSFAVAIAHGAGLMLVPIYLGLCMTGGPSDPGHEAAIVLASNNLAVALAVSAVHTTAMIVVGGIMAWAVYRYFGPQLLSKLWINSDGFWALSLIAVGATAFLANL
jgi:56kDa selenium binding protein (SBP56)